MDPEHKGLGPADLPVSEPEAGEKFKSVRRVFRIMDLVSRRGEDLTAKQLASEIDTSLSSCYYLLNILADEGYIEKLAQGGGYRIGPAVSLLQEGGSRNPRSDFGHIVGPVVDELARRSSRCAYAAVLSDGEAAVTRATAPPDSPPVGVVEGFHGASHALALGKVLVANMGPNGLRHYMENHRREAFTPRTIVRKDLLMSHLHKVRTVGFATDFEEFAENLCCLAAPVGRGVGRIEGAIGVSTTARLIHKELQYLVRLVQEAAEEASALLRQVPER